MKRYLTAKEATDILGVTAATLYAYVSRGLVRSEATDVDSRARHYNADDVLKLKERKEQRQNPAKAAQSALHWGTPIMESSLTLITDQGPYYRGYSALGLAMSHTVEQVAALFWAGDFSQAERLFANNAPPSRPIAVPGISPKLPIPQRLR